MTNNTITTDDMYFAAALLSYGLKLTNIDKSDFRHQKFTFEGRVECCYVLDTEENIPKKVSKPSIDLLKVQYTSETLLLHPTYPNHVKKIKMMIHTE